MPTTQLDTPQATSSALREIRDLRPSLDSVGAFAALPAIL